GGYRSHRRCALGRAQLAYEARRRLAPQRGGEDPPLLLVVGIGVGAAALQDQLSDLRDGHRLVPVDLHERVVERVRRVDRVEDLLAGAPDLHTWPLLEEADRVAV